MMLRKIVERIAQNRTFKRRLPSGTWIYVSPDSQLKYFKASFDRDLLELASRHSSAEAVFWDIGANCGVLSFAPTAARQIIAVEADPFLVTILQKNAESSSLPVIIVPAAVYGSSGIAEFVIARRGRASNYLVAVGGNSQSGGERSRIMVPTITLDDLLERFGAPTLVKVDVEGAEVEVFNGGKRLLREIRPIIYFEATNSTFAECEKILHSSGYDLKKGAELNWLATPL